MAGGLVMRSDPVKLKQYEGRVTLYLVSACLVTASGGLLFGYDLGISGGVTSMDDFLEKFFPTVYRNQKSERSNNYCKYNSQVLQLFTSSLSLAGAAATFVAGYITRYHGRKRTILIGGISFLSGGVLNGAAQDIEMLIIGRILLGAGIGFATQAMPLYISEMSLPHTRGFLGVMAQSSTTIGILAASLINYGTGKLTPYGWRISLGLAAVPALILTLGGIFLPDTPTSLVERGRVAEGRQLLEKVRGVKTVDVEFEDLLEASSVSRAVKSSWRNLLKRRYRPQLVMALTLPAFQQLGGPTAITFYAPVLFRSIGFGSNGALMSAVILGTVKVSAIWFSMLMVDKWGRRTLFFEGGLQMAVCQIAVGVILQLKLGLHNSLDHTLGMLTIILICAFVAAFDWSWGPLAWLVPSEIFPLEIRSAAQSVVVAVNFLFTFLIGQVFLTMFCYLKAGTFFFFAGWLLFMTAFVALLLPETRNIPLEQMVHVWRQHWFWGRLYQSSDGDLERSIPSEEKAAPAKYAEDHHWL